MQRSHLKDIGAIALHGWFFSCDGLILGLSKQGFFDVWQRFLAPLFDSGFDRVKRITGTS